MVRSTLGILWNCLFTMIICTWNIHNLNMVYQRESDMMAGLELSVGTSSKPGDRRNGLSSSCWLQTSPLPLPLIAMIEPPNKLHQLKLRAKQQPVSWTKAHTKLTNMGGYVVWQRSQRGAIAGRDTALENKCLARQLSHLHLRQHNDAVEQISSE